MGLAETGKWHGIYLHFVFMARYRKCGNRDRNLIGSVDRNHVSRCNWSEFDGSNLLFGIYEGGPWFFALFCLYGSIHSRYDWISPVRQCNSIICLLGIGRIGILFVDRILA